MQRHLASFKDEFLKTSYLIIQLYFQEMECIFPEIELHYENAAFLFTNPPQKPKK